MTLMVYNFITKKKEAFTPITPGFVGMYVCGPTVYDNAHIGHAKLYVSMDAIVRYLRYQQYNLRFVQNITDVGHLLDSGEDRILKRARRDRLEPMQLAEMYTRSYLDDMDALHNTRPDIMPRAAGHVPEQIEAIKVLIEKGHAYHVNGSVYFDVSSFPAYGKLSGQRVDELEEGSRLNVRPEKRSPEDFALWKRAEEGHILRWNSPWGVGFPGWHIECTAMSMKYLGQTFDIHGGGVDNLFPHNECELAQSEAMNDQPLANYWLLAGTLTVDGVKMSKSLGNFLTIKDALEQYPAEVLRFFILSSHYRSPTNYSEEAIAASRRGLERLTSTVLTVRDRLTRPNLPESGEAQFTDIIDETRARFVEAMNDDFNTPSALAALFDFTKNVNVLLNEESSVSRSTLEAIDALYNELGGSVLGVVNAETTSNASPERESELIQLLIDVRNSARQSKDFATADVIRDRLNSIGVVLEDSKGATTWSINR